MSQTARLLLRPDEVQEQLVCKRTTLYTVYIAQGHLHPIKVGRKVLFDAQQVADLVDKIRTGDVVIGSRAAYPAERVS